MLCGSYMYMYMNACVLRTPASVKRNIKCESLDDVTGYRSHFTVGGEYINTPDKEDSIPGFGRGKDNQHRPSEASFGLHGNIRHCLITCTSSYLTMFSSQMIDPRYLQYVLSFQRD
uniref:Uncharacterized protein n=1 Tax=Penaeus semisulcatus majanivirus TaxID=2984274 RepID=A0A9C7C865_9VIRU|nr:MAG: hypothetical protein [Penaeus semisulcatus majanivirus]